MVKICIVTPSDAYVLKSPGQHLMGNQRNPSTGERWDMGGVRLPSKLTPSHNTRICAVTGNVVSESQKDMY